jgi:hypothetical protein
LLIIFVITLINSYYYVSQSHALYYQHIRDLECPIEYDQVLRVTTLRYRCSSSLERSQVLQSPRIITTNNELHDDFFKVRPSLTPRENSTNNGDRVHESEEEEEEEYGLYVDSDEEEDEEDNKSSKQKEEQPQNEAWSLVEVAPFIVSGRTAHNGNEGESLFQLGAASIMPGVMNMMESLNNNNNLPDRNWLPRKKKNLK